MTLKKKYIFLLEQFEKKLNAKNAKPNSKKVRGVANTAPPTK